MRLNTGFFYTLQMALAPSIRALRFVTFLAAVLAIATPGSAQTLTVAQRASIDAYALAAPPEVEKSTQTLAEYLTRNLRTEPEKLRSIYRWMADRIEYDVDAYLSGRIAIAGATDVLAQRKAVCEGFASLFEDLARQSGLNVKSIAGYAKGYSTVRGHRFDKPNHMWSAVQINGDWQMVDATWGAGYVADGKYIKTLSEAFFLVPPEQFVFSHLPAESSWQLQRTPRLTQAEFEALPPVQPNFFNNAISPLEAWETVKNPEFQGAFVQTFDVPYRLATVRKAPLAYHLKLDRPYQFSIETEAFEKMALVQSGQWMEMDHQADAFTASYQSRTPGQLMVVGKKAGSSEYTAILAYELRP
jgi:transglutaminase-like putative cysteine protease